MKVGIDTFGSDHGRSGIGSYITSLVKNLPDEKDITFDIFGSEYDRYTFNSDSDHCTYTGVNKPDSISAERLWQMLKVKDFDKKNEY